MRPPSQHSKFFSSLKQVEKRLKLETPIHPPNSSPAPENIQINHTLTESLGTPMFIHSELEPNAHSSTAQESSEPPIAFLSSSPQFPPIHQTLARDFSKEQHNPTPIEAKIGNIDEIDTLMQLLGLSNCERGEENEEDDAGFYEKIVGVKGPKNRKERKRLDGWIRHFLQSGDGGEGTTETLSLGYLLLGKAACELENGDSHGYGGLDFPSAIEEFLKNDPPTDLIS